ncbi:hypothetical protein [Candidatus Hakubella thermalkaliphila]|uniref:hypothetical protein n=1 Tax=Candidatus Hakubella thermalkaliphila TaxID=2754717 RepID=UPI001C61160B|nr:hypothetical protein [Candidatus Hakubella thermalkaliphila]
MQVLQNKSEVRGEASYVSYAFHPPRAREPRRPGITVIMVLKIQTVITIIALLILGTRQATVKPMAKTMKYQMMKF